MKRRINRLNLIIRSTNIKVKSPNILKLKAVLPLKFMVTHTGRIASILVTTMRIIIILEKGSIMPMRIFMESLEILSP